MTENLAMDTELPNVSNTSGGGGGPESGRDWHDRLMLTPTECQSLSLAFIAGGVFGSGIQLLVLTVFAHKQCTASRRNASDQLFVALTLVDLIACVTLFPLEAIKLRSDKCNIPLQGFGFFISFFLEVSSTLCLVNIAINRVVLICAPTRALITYRTGFLMSAANLAVSALLSTVIVCSDENRTIMVLYTVFITSNLVTMTGCYVAIFIKLYLRARRQKRTRNQLHHQHQALELTTLTSVARTTQGASRDGEKRAMNGSASSLRPAAADPKSPASPLTQLEKMRNKSAVISCIVTAVYLVCFLPTQVLIISYLVNPRFLEGAPDAVMQSVKYLQLFYNLNFLATPSVYALLSHQFRNDCAGLIARVKRSGGLNIR